MPLELYREENRELRLKLQAAMARIAELEKAPQAVSSHTRSVAASYTTEKKKVDSPSQLR